MSKKESRLDVGFLHASPLVYKEGGLAAASPQLQFMAEKHTIKQCISEANQAIRFRSMVATQEKFSEMLSLEPQVLHISCHGIGKKSQNLLSSIS